MTRRRGRRRIFKRDWLIYNAVMAGMVLRTSQRGNVTETGGY
jgi:hypothetical protein